MSAAAVAWARLATTAAVAVLGAAALAPPQPARRLPAAAATLAGLAAGGALFVAAARRRPALRRGVAYHLAVGVYAASEEIVWRRVLLGELLAAGSLAALTLSSAGFALAHRRARPLHVTTGATFGALYLATGFLGACIAAHWLYNLLVGALAERAPP